MIDNFETLLYISGNTFLLNVRNYISTGLDLFNVIFILELMNLSLLFILVSGIIVQRTTTQQTFTFLQWQWFLEMKLIVKKG